MRKIGIHWLLVGSLFLGGCNSRPVKEKPNINAIKENSVKETIRFSILQQTAREYGAQSGLAWQARNLGRMLKRDQHFLDTIFNFRFLILGEEILPPVLEEGRHRLELKDEQTIRCADQLYFIVQPPKLITAAPTWHAYLFLNYSKPEEPNISLLPKTAVEKRIWNKYVQKGWFEGIEQANKIFDLQLHHLVRDFQGMILYRKLLAQNIVTPPCVAQADLGITGDDKELHINDRVLRITSITQFNKDPKEWRPVVPKKMNYDHIRSKEEYEGNFIRFESNQSGK